MSLTELFSGVFAPALQQQGSLLPGWVWLVLILVLIVIVIWAILRNTEGGDQVEVHEHHEAEAEPLKVEVPAVVEAVVAEHPAPPEPDDLTVIEGIGPKISSIFQAAGITTFAQLAETSVERLQAILDEADIRLGDPATWPEQAGLAAAGEWEKLEALQEELQGGHRD
jgi:predicted flap endonuclease-1-like 5' DNA nuclease